jgi:hypothetical protein
LLPQGRKLEVPNVEQTQVKNIYFENYLVFAGQAKDFGIQNHKKISKFISSRVTEFPVRKPRNIGKENIKVRF